MRTIKGIMFLSILLLLWLCQCQYHLLGKELKLPGGVSRIYVEPARNDTLEAGLEQVFTQRLLEHLQADGRVKLVKKDEAEAVLRTEVFQARDQSLSFDQFGRVTLIQVQVSASATLIASKENRKLWDTGILQDREQYPVGDDFLRNDQLRKMALNQASIRLSRIIVEMLTSDF